MRIVESFKQLTKYEIALWLASLAAVVISIIPGGWQSLPSCAASAIGLTALILVARGDVLGQILMIIFSLIYAIISFKLRYYGEMITYVGMSAPIAALSVWSWIKHPYKDNKHEVEVNRLHGKEIAFIAVLTVAVTVIFYFILAAFGTANLPVSTVSVTTSFAASYLMFRRSPFYALVYAANDIVLIVLWSMAAISDISCISMVICFIMFFVNDIYGFYSWHRMHKRQKSER